MPLNTRDGVAEAPIEPGARMLCEPWPRGPLEKLWRLIVPWKPLPIPMPATLTSSPGSKTSTVTVSPSTAPSIPPRNSTSVRCGADAEALQVPELGLRELPVRRPASNASCTAS